MIQVTLGSGSSLFVFERTTVGIYAVHEAVVNGRPYANAWTTTHTPSGLAIWTTRTFEDAVKVAEWLHAYPHIPAGREEFIQWRDREDSLVALCTLEGDLRRLAPRYNPGTLQDDSSPLGVLE